MSTEQPDTSFAIRPAAASPAVRAAAARAFLAEELEPNTKRAYLSDVNAWVRYCTEKNLPEWPIDADTIVNYIEHLVVTGKALKTIQRRIGGLRSALKAAGRPLETHVAEAASRALVVARKKIMKEGTREPDAESPQEPAGGSRRGRGKAPAFTVAEMRRICEACPPRLLGVRDRAMFLLGFAIGARRSELSALDIGDVTEVERGLEIHVRWSKTGTERFPKVPYGQHLSTCPVRAWRAWLAASGLVDGAAFRHIDRYGRLRNRLSPEGVGDALTAAAARAGLGHRTAHGLRSGMATEGRRAKHDAIAIARQGGWAPYSREMLGYMQVIDEWEDNPLYGIGL
ncbi:integrase [Planobispora rosea]|uniref:Integrase n=1 Tax=Planobispora rosea TaxID=35762 RepID=A0A8J3S6Y7_PLARO|nr:tyrosine-type recombinase/integrase [Planobispora rosea]GGS98644.1 integrase [Planobispora rosea]GIH87959.1 integrase [Planobispora rosea]